MAHKFHTSRHSLCFVCEKINFRKYLVEPIRSTIELGTVREILSRTECPFCNVVAHSLEAVPIDPEDTLKLSNQKSWKLCVIKSDYDRWRFRNYSNQCDLSLRDHRDAETTHTHAYQLLVSDSRETLVQVQYLADKERSKSHRQFFGRRVEEFVNWDLLRSWLSECNRHHTNSCRGNSSNPLRLPDRFRLIDVINEEIVLANRHHHHEGYDRNRDRYHDQDHEYVALSYVWGTQAMKRPMVTLTKKWCDERIPLPKNLQKTILDAIAVTRKLGYRYLWNDALCIIQDSKEDVKAQTDRMDAIYKRAKLTIVAVSGNHADSGLSGVTSPRKLCQYSRVVDGLRLANVLTPFEYVVSKYRSDLVWNSRAWTLQEKVLSNRILVFANWQVYFRCCNAVWCEDIAMETGWLSNSILRNADPFMWPMNRPRGKRRTIVNGLLDIGGAVSTPAKSSAFMNGIIRPFDLFNNDLKIYGSIIEEYTRRSLSYQSDILRAISGVLRTFEPSFGRFVCGMPVDFLDKALTWRPSPQARSKMTREYAPSWSWAGWEFFGHGCFWGNMNRWDEMTRRPIKHTFKWGDDSQMIISASFFRRFDHSKEHFLPSMSMWVVTETEHIPVWISKFGEPIEPKQPPPLHMRRHLELVGSLLVFDTTMIKLRIGSMVVPDPRDKDVPEIKANTDDETTLFELVDDQCRCIGEVWTTHEVARQARSRPLTFITICWGGAPFEAVRVADYYFPFWVEAGETVSSSQSQKEKRLDPHRALSGSVWDLVNILLVEQDGDIWRRVAFGRVVISAWFEAERDNGWIVIG